MVERAKRCEHCENGQKTAITVFRKIFGYSIFQAMTIAKKILKSRSQQNGNDTKVGDRPILSCTQFNPKKKERKFFIHISDPQLPPTHIPSPNSIPFEFFSAVCNSNMNEIICSQNKRAQLTIPIYFLLSGLSVHNILVFGFIQSKWHVHIFSFPHATCNMQLCTVHDA